jgi:hypothetical protein
MGQRRLEENTAVGRDKEASTVIIVSSIHGTYVCGLIIRTEPYASYTRAYHGRDLERLPSTPHPISLIIILIVDYSLSHVQHHVPQNLPTSKV